MCMQSGEGVEDLLNAQNTGKVQNIFDYRAECKKKEL